MVAAAYPDHPGHKRRRTSRAAAEAIAPKAGSIRSRVYDALKVASGTPEEVAARIGEPVMNCRPRFSEPSARNLIRDTGQRRTAMGGREAIVWEVIP
jgi:hypothetical protein